MSLRRFSVTARVLGPSEVASSSSFYACAGVGVGGYWWPRGVTVTIELDDPCSGEVPAGAGAVEIDGDLRWVAMADEAPCAPGAYPTVVGLQTIVYLAHDPQITLVAIDP